MNTKQIISLAIFAVLPCAANATDPVVAVGPAHASSNAVVATASAPYQTVTPGNDDDKHIASTKYVIGAYNDAIAAVNKVDSEKQAKLVNSDTHESMVNRVAGAGTMDDKISILLDSDLETILEATDSEIELVSVGGVLGAIDTLLYRAGVEIHTTWEDDSATMGLQLKDIHEILPE